jgi:hypothetical protein
MRATEPLRQRPQIPSALQPSISAQMSFPMHS